MTTLLLEDLRMAVGVFFNLPLNQRIDRQAYKKVRLADGREHGFKSGLRPELTRAYYVDCVTR